MAHEVMCRLCKQRFDIEQEEGVVVGKQSYYHKKCYDEWRKGCSDANVSMDTGFWYEALVDYLYRDVKMAIDFQKLQSQWNNFTQKGKNMTPKGVYFAMRYFYDVIKGSPEKAQGGIGIVSTIYNKSAQYWVDKENQKSGTLDAIIKQIRIKEARPVQLIKKVADKKRDKTKWNLEDI